MPTDAAAILDDWIGPGDLRAEDFKPYHDRWYRSDPDFDEELRERFGETLKAAEAGELDGWRDSPEGCVALVILFDQFSRNLYRGTAAVYRNDRAALDIARHVIDQGWQDQLTVPARLMLYHPFLHAEDLTAQNQCEQLFEALHDNCDPVWKPLVASHLKFVRDHADVIDQFGRFPHRNDQLGRTTTAEEAAFLQKDSRSYGQGKQPKRSADPESSDPSNAP